jgi:hypothetical protein
VEPAKGEGEGEGEAGAGARAGRKKPAKRWKRGEYPVSSSARWLLEEAP